MSRETKYPAVLSLRIAEDTSRELDDVAAKYPALGGRHGVARRCIELGLAAVRRDFRLLLANAEDLGDEPKPKRSK